MVSTEFGHCFHANGFGNRLWRVPSLLRSLWTLFASPQRSRIRLHLRPEEEVNNKRQKNILRAHIYDDTPPTELSNILQLCKRSEPLGLSPGLGDERGIFWNRKPLFGWSSFNVVTTTCERVIRNSSMRLYMRMHEYEAIPANRTNIVHNIYTQK